jgi:hypothetical protein
MYNGANEAESGLENNAQLKRAVEENQRDLYSP